MWTIILSLNIFFLIATPIESKSCDIWSSNIQDILPLPLFENDNGLVFLTEQYGILRIEDGESLTMSCPGSHLQYYGVDYKKLNSAKVTCKNETLFSDDWFPGESLSMKWISCLSPPPVIYKPTENKCGDQNKGKMVEIYIESLFYNKHLLYETCFDDSIKQPLYSVYNLTKAKLNKFPNNGKKYFKGDSEMFEGVQLNILYDNRHQMNVFNSILGSIYWDYFKFGDLLINGSLILPDGFQFDPMQRATYEYINGVPIWDKIQSGSWRSSYVLGIQELAEKANITVYSGAWGIQTLKDTNGEQKEIYSIENKDSERYPIPQWLYRVAYDESSKKGIALLVLNSPFLELEEGEELAKIFSCEDACPKWYWLQNIVAKNGYVTCCEIDDFRKVIKDLPEFETVGLLP